MGAGGYKTLNGMKRVVIFLLLAIGLSESTVAQKGMQSVGVNIPVNYRDKNLSTGIGLNYQYNLSDFFRGEFFASHTPIQLLNSYSYSPDHSEDIIERNCYIDWQVFINAHYFLSAPKLIRPYILYGVGIQDYYLKDNSIAKSDRIFWERELRQLCFSMNFGLGLDVRLGYHWTMQLTAIALSGFLSGEIANRDAVKRMDIGASIRIGVNYNF